MNLPSKPFALFILLAALLLPGATAPDVAAQGATQETAEEKPPGPPPGRPKGPGGHPDGRERWSALSEEERVRLREALREVWADPVVVSAREGVTNATEAYQEAIRVAIVRDDPELAELLKRVQAASEGMSRERVGGGPQGPFGGRRPGDHSMGPPAFLDRLSEGDRERFLQAEEKAKSSEAVMAARKELDELRKQDEQLRVQRMEAYRRMRKAILGAIIEADPGLREKLEELDHSRFDPNKGGKGGFPKGKGKGKEDSRE